MLGYRKLEHPRSRPIGAPSLDSSGYLAVRLERILGAALCLLLTCLMPCRALAQDCNENTIPDVCDIHCGPPGGTCDVPGCGQSSDCDGDGILDECELRIRERDCDSDGVCNGPQIAACAKGDSSCADCNGNQIPDAYDIGIVPGGRFPAEIDLANLDGSNGFILKGVGEKGQLGHSVASAGDINGDGIDDLIFGAPFRG